MRFAALSTLFVAALAVAAQQQQPLNKTPSPGTYHKPDETASLMKVPPGFKVQVFASEPEIVQPIGYAMDARGRLWVLENLSYPDWKAEGHDRITILEDTDGDGKFDTKKLFWDKGNFATGIQVGFGGVWVGTPPHLLFIPDKDGDDVPDGEPVKLLDGWGAHDTHETMNSFVWGPDGWLYGCQGVFTQSKVGKPGTPDAERQKVNAAVWRYHPTRHVFEVFAEGGSNQWGVDFNDQGQAFITACVIPHLYHVALGGRYKRQGGQHENPHTYADIQTIRTHNHFAAAFAGSMIYLGDNFPEQYRNQIFMNNIHANKIHADWLERQKSGYTAKFGPHDQPAKGEDRGTGFMNSEDKWYRGLSLQTGPDGGVFVCDWYDQLPCHQLKPHDRTNGRVYKITYEGVKALKGIDLSKQPDEELVKLQLHKNDWWVRTARRVLQERAAAGKDMAKARAGLLEILRQNPDVTRQLRALWALHATGGIDEKLALELLGSREEYVRAWTLQCATEERKAPAELRARMATLAKEDTSPVVRLYLASACGRLPLPERATILEELVKHEEDAVDQNLPFLYWYAIEPIVPADAEQARKLLVATKIPKVREWITRRLTAAAGGK